MEGKTRVLEILREGVLAPEEVLEEAPLSRVETWGADLAVEGMQGLARPEVQGNLKEVERILGLSYPTVRARLDALLKALGYEAQEDGAGEGLRSSRP